jgi:hypothetical protein
MGDVVEDTFSRFYSRKNEAISNGFGHKFGGYFERV